MMIDNRLLEYEVYSTCLWTVFVLSSAVFLLKYTTNRIAQLGTQELQKKGQDNTRCYAWQSSPTTIPISLLCRHTQDSRG